MLMLVLLFAVHPPWFIPGVALAPNGTQSTTASGDTRSLYIRGEKALAQGDLAQAEAAFRQVLDQNPSDPGANAN
ncbi:MAG TPA: tetratricopeptide repeat protein, partial [Terriglobales bacterium]|nr:tetratricopeptide repeat protein [Terriglobales bacterium]